jgi:ribosomal protein S27E
MNFLRNFMAGRYGPDHLNTALIITALVISLISRITNFYVLVYISYIMLAFALFRMLSRNIPKRRAENDRYIRYWWPVKQKIKMSVTGLKNRKTHRFFSCPSCRNILRVPRGKGKMQITCPKCGERFIKKT